MTSTNDGKEVKNATTSAPKGKSHLIEIYKSLERTLTGDGKVAERGPAAVNAWRQLERLCQGASNTGARFYLIQWAHSRTAAVVLQSDWQAPGNAALRSSLDTVLAKCCTANGETDWQMTLARWARGMRRLAAQPWDHVVLRALLDKKAEQPSDDEVVEWLVEEHGSTLVSRLRQLTSAKCDDLALQLASAVCNLFRSSIPADAEKQTKSCTATTSSVGENSDVKKQDLTGIPSDPGGTKRRYVERLQGEGGFSDEVVGTIQDAELVLLHKLGNQPRCIELLKSWPLDLGATLVKRVSSRAHHTKSDKKLWKHAKQLATLAAQVLVARCMVAPVQQHGRALYDLVRLVAHLTGNSTSLHRTVAALAAPANTSAHIRITARAIVHQCGDAMRPLACELYVRALTAGMNELERAKLSHSSATEARLAERALAGWLLELAEVLAGNVRVAAECTLTAFSVHPSPELYRRVGAACLEIERVKEEAETANETEEDGATKCETTSSKQKFGSWAGDSRPTHTNLVKTSTTIGVVGRDATLGRRDVVSAAVLDGDGLGLSPDLCQDLAMLLRGPRVKTLTWDMEREELLENCRAYMMATKGGTQAVVTELKYLHLDPSQYAHLPSLSDDDEKDIYYGIEKGYEHHLELEDEDESPENVLWETASMFSDMEAPSGGSRRSSVDSDYVSGGRPRRRDSHRSEGESNISPGVGRSKKSRSISDERKEDSGSDVRSGKAKTKNARKTSTERNKKPKGEKKRREKKEKKPEAANDSESGKKKSKRKSQKDSFPGNDKSVVLIDGEFPMDDGAHVYNSADSLCASDILQNNILNVEDKPLPALLKNQISKVESCHDRILKVNQQLDVKTPLKVYGNPAKTSVPILNPSVAEVVAQTSHLEEQNKFKTIQSPGSSPRKPPNSIKSPIITSLLSFRREKIRPSCASHSIISNTTPFLGSGEMAAHSSSSNIRPPSNNTNAFPHNTNQELTQPYNKVQEAKLIETLLSRKMNTLAYGQTSVSPTKNVHVDQTPSAPTISDNLNKLTQNLTLMNLTKGLDLKVSVTPSSDNSSPKKIVQRPSAIENPYKSPLSGLVIKVVNSESGKTKCKTDNLLSPKSKVQDVTKTAETVNKCLTTPLQVNTKTERHSPIKLLQTPIKIYNPNALSSPMKVVNTSLSPKQISPSSIKSEDGTQKQNSQASYQNFLRELKATINAGAAMDRKPLIAPENHHKIQSQVLDKPKVNDNFSIKSSSISNHLITQQKLREFLVQNKKTQPTVDERDQQNAASANKMAVPKTFARRSYMKQKVELAKQQNNDVQSLSRLNSNSSSLDDRLQSGQTKETLGGIKIKYNTMLQPSFLSSNFKDVRTASPNLLHATSGKTNSESIKSIVANNPMIAKMLDSNSLQVNLVNKQKSSAAPEAEIDSKSKSSNLPNFGLQKVKEKLQTHSSVNYSLTKHLPLKVKNAPLIHNHNLHKPNTERTTKLNLPLGILKPSDAKTVKTVTNNEVSPLRMSNTDVIKSVGDNDDAKSPNAWENITFKGKPFKVRILRNRRGPSRSNMSVKNNANATSHRVNTEKMVAAEDGDNIIPKCTKGRSSMVESNTGHKPKDSDEANITMLLGRLPANLNVVKVKPAHNEIRETTADGISSKVVPNNCSISENQPNSKVELKKVSTFERIVENEQGQNHNRVSSEATETLLDEEIDKDLLREIDELTSEEESSVPTAHSPSTDGPISQSISKFETDNLWKVSIVSDTERVGREIEKKSSQNDFINSNVYQNIMTKRINLMCPVLRKRVKIQNRQPYCRKSLYPPIPMPWKEEPLTEQTEKVEKRQNKNLSREQSSPVRHKRKTSHKKVGPKSRMIQLRTNDKCDKLEVKLELMNESNTENVYDHFEASEEIPPNLKTKNNTENINENFEVNKEILPNLKAKNNIENINDHFEASEEIPPNLKAKNNTENINENFEVNKEILPNLKAKSNTENINDHFEVSKEIHPNLEAKSNTENINDHFEVTKEILPNLKAKSNTENINDHFEVSKEIQPNLKAKSNTENIIDHFEVTKEILPDLKAKSNTENINDHSNVSKEIQSNFKANVSQTNLPEVTESKLNLDQNRVQLDIEPSKELKETVQKISVIKCTRQSQDVNLCTKNVIEQRLASVANIIKDMEKTIDFGMESEAKDNYNKPSFPESNDVGIDLRKNKVETSFLAMESSPIQAAEKITDDKESSELPVDMNLQVEDLMNHEFSSCTAYSADESSNKEKFTLLPESTKRVKNYTSSSSVDKVTRIEELVNDEITSQGEAETDPLDPLSGFDVPFVAVRTRSGQKDCSRPTTASPVFKVVELPKESTTKAVVTKIKKVKKKKTVNKKQIVVKKLKRQLKKQVVQSKNTLDSKSEILARKSIKTWRKMVAVKKKNKESVYTRLSRSASKKTNPASCIPELKNTEISTEVKQKDMSKEKPKEDVKKEKGDSEEDDVIEIVNDEEIRCIRKAIDPLSNEDLIGKILPDTKTLVFNSPNRPFKYVATIRRNPNLDMEDLTPILKNEIMQQIRESNTNKVFHVNIRTKIKDKLMINPFSINSGLKPKTAGDTPTEIIDLISDEEDNSKGSDDNHNLVEKIGDSPKFGKWNVIGVSNEAFKKFHLNQLKQECRVSVARHFKRECKNNHIGSPEKKLKISTEKVDFLVAMHIPKSKRHPIVVAKNMPLDAINNFFKTNQCEPLKPVKGMKFTPGPKSISYLRNIRRNKHLDDLASPRQPETVEIIDSDDVSGSDAEKNYSSKNFEESKHVSASVSSLEKTNHIPNEKIANFLVTEEIVLKNNSESKYVTNNEVIQSFRNITTTSVQNIEKEESLQEEFEDKQVPKKRLEEESSEIINALEDSATSIQKQVHKISVDKLPFSIEEINRNTHMNEDNNCITEMPRRSKNVFSDSISEEKMKNSELNNDNKNKNEMCEDSLDRSPKFPNENVTLIVSPYTSKETAEHKEPDKNIMDLKPANEPKITTDVLDHVEVKNDITQQIDDQKLQTFPCEEQHVITKTLKEILQHSDHNEINVSEENKFPSDTPDDSEDLIFNKKIGKSTNESINFDENYTVNFNEEEVMQDDTNVTNDSCEEFRVTADENSNKVDSFQCALESSMGDSEEKSSSIIHDVTINDKSNEHIKEENIIEEKIAEISNNKTMDLCENYIDNSNKVDSFQCALESVTRDSEEKSSSIIRDVTINDKSNEHIKEDTFTEEKITEISNNKAMDLCENYIDNSNKVDTFQHVLEFASRDFEEKSSPLVHVITTDGKSNEQINEHNITEEKIAEISNNKAKDLCESNSNKVDSFQCAVESATRDSEEKSSSIIHDVTINDKSNEHIKEDNIIEEKIAEISNNKAMDLCDSYIDNSNKVNTFQHALESASRDFEQKSSPLIHVVTTDDKSNEQIKEDNIIVEKITEISNNKAISLCESDKDKIADSINTKEEIDRSPKNVVKDLHMEYEPCIEDDDGEHSLKNLEVKFPIEMNEFEGSIANAENVSFVEIEKFSYETSSETITKIQDTNVSCLDSDSLEDEDVADDSSINSNACMVISDVPENNKEVVLPVETMTVESTNNLIVVSDIGDSKGAGDIELMEDVREEYATLVENIPLNKNGNNGHSPFLMETEKPDSDSQTEFSLEEHTINVKDEVVVKDIENIEHYYTPEEVDRQHMDNSNKDNQIQVNDSNSTFRENTAQLEDYQTIADNKCCVYDNNQLDSVQIYQNTEKILKNEYGIDFFFQPKSLLHISINRIKELDAYFFFALKKKFNDEVCEINHINESNKVIYVTTSQEETFEPIKTLSSTICTNHLETKETETTCNDNICEEAESNDDTNVESLKVVKKTEDLEEQSESNKSIQVLGKVGIEVKISHNEKELNECEENNTKIQDLKLLSVSGQVENDFTDKSSNNTEQDSDVNQSEICTISREKYDLGNCGIVEEVSKFDFVDTAQNIIDTLKVNNTGSEEIENIELTDSTDNALDARAKSTLEDENNLQANEIIEDVNNPIAQKATCPETNKEDIEQPRSINNKTLVISSSDVSSKSTAVESEVETTLTAATDVKIEKFEEFQIKLEPVDEVVLSEHKGCKDDSCKNSVRNKRKRKADEEINLNLSDISNINNTNLITDGANFPNHGSSVNEENSCVAISDENNICIGKLDKSFSPSNTNKDSGEYNFKSDGIKQELIDDLESNTSSCKKMYNYEIKCLQSNLIEIDPVIQTAKEGTCVSTSLVDLSEQRDEKATLEQIEENSQHISLECQENIDTISNCESQDAIECFNLTKCSKTDVEPKAIIEDKVNTDDIYQGKENFDFNFYIAKLPQKTYSHKRMSMPQMKRKQIPLHRPLAKRSRRAQNIDLPKSSKVDIDAITYKKEIQFIKSYNKAIALSDKQIFLRSKAEIDLENMSAYSFNRERKDIVNLEIDMDSDSSTKESNFLFEDICEKNEHTDRDTFYSPIFSEEELKLVQEHEQWMDTGCEEEPIPKGFGEVSDRVITSTIGRKNTFALSAATLSDVKQQPHRPSEDSENDGNIHNGAIGYSLLSKLRDYFKKNPLGEQTSNNILKPKVIRSRVATFDYKPKIQVCTKRTSKLLNLLTGVPGLDGFNYIQPTPNRQTVQVVQVGQLPVTAAGQNPSQVSCSAVDTPAETPASQCNDDTTQHDETLLTTADFSELNETPKSEVSSEDANLIDSTNEAGSELSLIGLDERDSSDCNNQIHVEPLSDHMHESGIIHNHIEESAEDAVKCFENEVSSMSGVQMKYDEAVTVTEHSQNINSSVPLSADTPVQIVFTSPMHQNNFSSAETGTNKDTSGFDKSEQFTATLNNSMSSQVNRAHALVNMLSQKLVRSPGTTAATQPTVSTSQSKPTGVTTMSLQQALAQILPPPLSQSSSAESTQQNSNVTPQVLHIVQGKTNPGQNQITLVDNSQQSVLNSHNAQVLHIVQNKSATTNHNTTNNVHTPVSNAFGGISLVETGIQQTGNQVLHIVNTGNQTKMNATAQLLKRVNLLTSLTNVQGANEQKMVQFVCKSADGKSIQLNAPHQRSMVLRLQPIETPTNQNAKIQEGAPPNVTIGANHNKKSPQADQAQQEIKSRSIYEENYAKFIQSSTNKTAAITNEKSTSLPKFNQAFGKAVFQDTTSTAKANDTDQENIPLTNISVNLNDTGDQPTTAETAQAMNIGQTPQLSNPPLLIRKSQPTPQQNLVQQLKQTIAPMNIQTMHGGVIYTRQIPVNIGGGQTINLITVPSTELIDDSQKAQEIKFTTPTEGLPEQSIIKIIPQSQQGVLQTETTSEESNQHPMNADSNSQPQAQPLLTQMRIKLPMLSKTPQVVPGARVVRPFLQIQRNVIAGTNPPVYQQLLLTTTPQLSQQNIRLPQMQPTRQVKVPAQNQSSESNMSTSTLEQLREFDMVLEQVKERSTVQPSAGVAFANISPQAAEVSPEASNSTVGSNAPREVLYSIGANQTVNVTYVNQKVLTSISGATTFTRTLDTSVAGSSTSQIPHSSNSPQGKNANSNISKVASKSVKSKSSKPVNLPPAAAPKTSAPVPPKTSIQKPLEDEQTTQRILYILAEYKEQVENSPDKDKPAPRRRSNPPTNPSSSSKRKKSSGGSSKKPSTGQSLQELSPVGGVDDPGRTMGSEDSSCGLSQGECPENGAQSLDGQSPQGSPQKVARKILLQSESEASNGSTSTPQPRNVIIADGQAIAVARPGGGKAATAVLMPANYLLPVSMVKGGQQITIVTNQGPKLLTVPQGEGGTNALLLQRLVSPAGLKPMLTRPGIRHVRLPTFGLASPHTVTPTNRDTLNWIDNGTLGSTSPKVLMEYTPNVTVGTDLASDSVVSETQSDVPSLRGDENASIGGDSVDANATIKVDIGDTQNEETLTLQHNSSPSEGVFSGQSERTVDSASTPSHSNAAADLLMQCRERLNQASTSGPALNLIQVHSLGVGESQQKLFSVQNAASLSSLLQLASKSGNQSLQSINLHSTGDIESKTNKEIQESGASVMFVRKQSLEEAQASAEQGHEGVKILPGLVTRGMAGTIIAVQPRVSEKTVSQHEIPVGQVENQDSHQNERLNAAEQNTTWRLVASSANNNTPSYSTFVDSPMAVTHDDRPDHTVLGQTRNPYSPDATAHQLFDKMFDASDTKKVYVTDLSHNETLRVAHYEASTSHAGCEDKPFIQSTSKKQHEVSGSSFSVHSASKMSTQQAATSAAALRHKYAILEHELRLQKSLSEECEDLGVDSPSASELFPEAELLFAASPAHLTDHSQDAHPAPPLLAATPQGLSELEAQLEAAAGGAALDAEEFARAHPNTTFHSELPDDDGEVQPYTISGGAKTRHIYQVSAETQPSHDHIKYSVPELHGMLHTAPPHQLSTTTFELPETNVAQVIHRNPHFLMHESGVGESGSVDSSVERHSELFWDTNSNSNQSEPAPAPLRFSSECSNDSDSVIKETDASSSPGAEDSTQPPLRTYLSKRSKSKLQADDHNAASPHSMSESSSSDGPMSLSKDTMDAVNDRSAEQEPESARRRTSVRGVVKRGCLCCNGSPAPSKPKKPRQKKNSTATDYGSGS